MSFDPLHKDFASKILALDTPTLYGETVTSQACLYQSKLSEILGSISHWKKASSILDVGCGPGATAKFLHANGLVKGKTYHGVDLESQFVKKAKSALSESAFHFSQGNVLTDDFGVADVLLLVAVLQHLGDLSKAVARLKHHLKKDGVLVFFDAGGAKTNHTHPEIPLLQELDRQSSKENTGGARNDQCLHELEGDAKKLGLKIIRAENISIPISKKDHMEFVKYSFLVCEITRRFYNHSVPHKNLLDDLIAWSKSPNATASMDCWRLVVATHA